MSNRERGRSSTGIRALEDVAPVGLDVVRAGTTSPRPTTANPSAQRACRGAAARAADGAPGAARSAWYATGSGPPSLTPTRLGRPRRPRRPGAVVERERALHERHEPRRTLKEAGGRDAGGDGHRRGAAAVGLAQAGGLGAVARQAGCARRNGADRVRRGAAAGERLARGAGDAPLERAGVGRARLGGGGNPLDERIDTRAAGVLLAPQHDRGGALGRERAASARRERPRRPSASSPRWASARSEGSSPRAIADLQRLQEQP